MLKYINHIIINTLSIELLINSFKPSHQHYTMLFNLFFGSLILLAFLLLLNATDYISFESKVWALNVQCIDTAPCTQSEEKIIQCVDDSPCVGYSTAKFGYWRFEFVNQ